MGQICHNLTKLFIVHSSLFFCYVLSLGPNILCFQTLSIYFAILMCDTKFQIHINQKAKLQYIFKPSVGHQKQEVLGRTNRLLSLRFNMACIENENIRGGDTQRARRSHKPPNKTYRGYKDRQQGDYISLKIVGDTHTNKPTQTATHTEKKVIS
jgi:hypothetical protein